MQIEQLDNGLTIVFRPLSSRRGVRICIGSRMSTRHEKIAQRGLTHFCEHGLLGGTEKIPPALVKKEIELLGGTINAFTGQDIVSIEGDFVSQDFKRAMKLVGDMFFFPSFPKDYIEQERQVIIQEIAEDNDNPWDCVSQEAMELFYKGSGVGIGGLGFKENVEKFKLRQIKEHWKKVSATENCVIHIVGNIGPKEMDFVRSRYGTLAHGKGICTRRTAIYPGNRGIKTMEKDQVYLSILFDSAPVEEHENAMRAEILSSILGQGMNSRIWKRVREKMGAAYDVRTQAISYRKNGHLEFLGALNPAKWEEAMEAMLDELKQLATKGPYQREVVDAVKGWLRYNMIIQDDPSFIADKDMENLFTNYCDDPFIRTAKIVESITQRDIKRFANQVFKSGDPTIQVLGPVDADHFS